MSRAPRHCRWLCPLRLSRFFSHSPRWSSVAAAPRMSHAGDHGQRPHASAIHVPCRSLLLAAAFSTATPHAGLVIGNRVLLWHAPYGAHRRGRVLCHPCPTLELIAGATSSAVHASWRSSSPGPRRPPSMPHIVEQSHWRSYRRQQRAGGDRDQCRTCVGRHYIVLPPTRHIHPHSLAVYPRRPSPTLLIVLLEQSSSQHQQQESCIGSSFHRSRATSTGGISSGAAHVADKTWLKEMVPKEAIPSHALGTVSRGITFPLI